MNINSKIFLLIALTSISILIPVSQAIAASDKYMIRYCKSSAEKHYNIEQSNITTLPVERSGHHYIVYGQSPKEGNNALFFNCEFNNSSDFISINKVSDTRRQSDNNNSGGQGNNLRHQCKIAAAKEFGLKRKNITVQRPVKEQGMFTIWGQFPSGQNDATVFTCTYTKQHELVRIKLR